MPQARHFLGVNSVTNIELDQGVMPVVIGTRERFFESFTGFLLI